MQTIYLSLKAQVAVGTFHEIPGRPKVLLNPVKSNGFLTMIFKIFKKKIFLKANYKKVFFLDIFYRSSIQTNKNVITFRSFILSSRDFSSHQSLFLQLLTHCRKDLRTMKLCKKPRARHVQTVTISSSQLRSTGEKNQIQE